MSILPLFRRSLGDSWRSLLAWTAGVLAALLLYLPLYSAIGGSVEMGALLDSLPDQLVKTVGYDQISTGAGYTQSTFYGLMGFLLLTIAATGWGTAAIAGDEEAGSLELTLAHSVSRTQIVVERTAAVAVRLAWLCLLSVIVVLALNDSAKLDIEPANVAAGAAALFGLTFHSSMWAIAIGALTGRRSYATAAGAGVAIVGYAFNAVANQNTDLEGLHAWSPYHWAFGGSPLLNGVDGMLWLNYLVAIVLLVVAVIALNRRDLKG